MKGNRTTSFTFFILFPLRHIIISNDNYNGVDKKAGKMKGCRAAGRTSKKFIVSGLKIFTSSLSRDCERISLTQPRLFKIRGFGCQSTMRIPPPNPLRKFRASYSRHPLLFFFSSWNIVTFECLAPTPLFFLRANVYNTWKGMFFFFPTSRALRSPKVVRRADWWPSVTPNAFVCNYEATCTATFIHHIFAFTWYFARGTSLP